MARGPPLPFNVPRAAPAGEVVRPATQAEVERGVALVDALEAKDGVGPGRALELYCLMVLNLNEFAYLD